MKSIWFIRIKDFVACHHCDKILGIAQIDDVMRPSRDHINGFDLIP